MGEKLEKFFEEKGNFLIKQKKEWGEIVLDFEGKNKYEVFDVKRQRVGFIAEAGKGGFFSILKLQLLRKFRPMEIKVWNSEKEEILLLVRPLRLFLPELAVYSQRKKIGSVKSRFAFFKKAYDLKSRGRVFSKIRAPFWSLGKFALLNPSGRKVGKIEKLWGNAFKEAFSDADAFEAAAVCIDLDYYEDNALASA